LALSAPTTYKQNNEKLKEMSQITLDPLDKFDENTKSTTSWIRKFSEYQEYYGWDEAQSLRLFKLHLRSDASEWYYQQAEGTETSKFLIKDWLEALKERFPDQSKVGQYSCGIGGLSQLRRQNDESMQSFIARFLTYKSKVDPKFYTDAYIIETFKDSLKETDQQLWWIIESRRELKDLKSIMNEAVHLENRYQAPNTTPLFIKDTTEIKKNKQVNFNDQTNHIDELTKQVEKLALLIKQEKPKTPLVCHSCGQAGHRSNDVRFHPDHPYAKTYETRRPSPATGANAVPLGDKLNILKEVSTTEESGNILATKRMRIDDLLNEPARIVRNPATTLNTKKRTVAARTTTTPLLNTMLDSPVPLTHRELLEAHPKLLKDVVQSFQTISRPKKLKLNALQVTEKESLKPSFVVARIKDQKVPIQIDNGADYSIIKREVIHRLKLSIIDLEKPIPLQGIQGPRFQAKECALLNLDLETGEITHPFIVLEEASCPILIGIDLLKRFNANLNYNTDVMTLDTGEEPLKLQLYTYQEAKIVCDNEDEEEELSEEDEQAALLNFLHEKPVQENETPEEINELLLTYKDLFVQHFTEIPGIQFQQCTIKLKPDATPVACRMPRYSPEQREVIKGEIDKMLDAGVIEPSTAPWTFPIVLAPKPDGTIRFCINYKKLNNLTIKDKFPLPRIDDCLDFLSGKTYFSTLDCFSGYWQCKLDEVSKPLTTFISPFGIFQFNVMPFGLTNAPAHFSRMMQSIFADLVHEILIIYLDDLCIASSSIEEHLKSLEAVFKRLREFDVKLMLKLPV
jgi:hypothetical protein